MGLIRKLAFALIVFGIYSTALFGFISGVSQANNVQLPPNLQQPNFEWQKWNSTIPDWTKAPDILKVFMLNIGSGYNAVALSLQGALSGLGINISFYAAQIVLLISIMLIITMLGAFLGFFSVL